MFHDLLSDFLSFKWYLPAMQQPIRWFKPFVQPENQYIEKRSLFGCYSGETINSCSFNLGFQSNKMICGIKVGNGRFAGIWS
jgi:hypothetical protein